METTLAHDAAQPFRSMSDRLNRSCFCITLDREALREAAAHETGDAGFL